MVSKLTLIKPTKRVGYQQYCLYRCECGVKKEIRSDHVKSKAILSCGCYRDKQTSVRRFKHGDSKHPLMNVWNNILQRCNNSNYILYQYYGARGIEVCAEWTNSFVSFRDWAIKNGYQKGLVIDRIDNDGNYEPGNCHWITHKLNMRNRKDNKLITAFNETKCMAEWAEDYRCKIAYNRLWQRIERLGWTPERAISEPPHKKTTV